MEGLRRAADAAECPRFHLFGYSAGGAVALAYVSRYPDSVLSLALDEPASDFSEPDRTLMKAANEKAAALNSDQRMAAFIRFQLALGVEPPPPPEGVPPPWMKSRPAGVAAFARALTEHRVPAGSWGRFEQPVYYSCNGLSHPRWREIGTRLGSEFRDYRMEVYEDLTTLSLRIR